MFSTARRTSRLLYIFIGLALAAGVVDAAEPDSDRDGLSDAQEMAVGLDPHSMDSNMDGISDLDAYRTLRHGVSGLAMLSQAAPAGPTSDADADGVRDFLETYGYYRQDNQLVGLKRIIPRADWNALAARGKVAGYKVYEFATTALTDNLLARYDSTNRIYIVDVAAAYPAIRAKFISRGIPENSVLITGSTADQGSIAAIMAELVTDRDPKAPTDSHGGALPVYFTHPLRRSTDQDPYSDYEEAMGLDGVATVESPANHPLVAALPAIRASLIKYSLTEISSTAVTLGERNSHTELENHTTTSSNSHGFSASVTGSHTFGVTNSGVSFSVSASTSHEWSSATAVQTGQQNAHETFSQRANAIDTNCFAKLGLTIQIENVGSDMASNIVTSLDVHLGDTLWRTVPISYPGLTLEQHRSVTVTVLGQGSDNSCLTLAQTNYLQQGGSIGIRTVMADANINVYDPRLLTIVQTGSWNTYRAKIENDLARIDLSATTTNGTNILTSFWVVAAQDGYPNLGISIEEVLGRVYQRFTCSAKGLAASACFATNSGDIALTDAAAVDFSFYDEAGQIRPRMESRDRYLALAGDDNRPLSKIPAQRTIVSIVQHASNVPVFSHAEVLSQLDPATSSNANGPVKVDAQVRALVRDFSGIKSVEFCFKVNDCTPMTSAKGTAQNSTSGLYEISLQQYTFKGGEHLRARNVNEIEAQLQPTVFFLTLSENLHNSLAAYAEKLASKDRAIAQLTGFRLVNGDEYNRILNSGLIGDVDAAQEDNSPLEQLRDALEKAGDACAYKTSTAENLAADLQACLSYVGKDLADAFNRDIPAYNPVKLPVPQVDGTETGWDRSHRDDLQKVRCQLKPGQFLVGLDLAKANAYPMPTAWFRYVTWDRYSGTLSAKNEIACGVNTSRDSTFNTPATSTAHKANLILDVGASIGGSKKSNKSNGQVTRLCVRYRTFNFKTGQFEGSSQTDCNGSSKLESTEASTGKLGVSDSTEALFGLIIGGGSNSEFQYMRGIHLENLAQRYEKKPWNTLVSGGRYRIETSAGEVLTITGAGTNSRGLTVATRNGSDNQVWIVEAVNDRQFRLTPKSYEGFVTRTSQAATTITVNAPAAGDELTVNFLQHWRLEQFPSGEYLIHSVLDDKKVLAADLNPQAASRVVNLEAFSPDDLGQQWRFVRLDDPRFVLTSTKSLTLALPSTTLWNQDHYCAPILDSSDKTTGNPRYVNRIALTVALPAAEALRIKTVPGSAYSARGEIQDDARQPLAKWGMDWWYRDPAKPPIEIALPRYVSTTQLRLCGVHFSYQPNTVLQKVEIAAACKSNVTDLGPAVESCQSPQAK